MTSAVLTLNQLVATMEPELGPGARRPRHLPRPVLRAIAAASTTQPGRQAEAALDMDGCELRSRRRVGLTRAAPL